MQITKLEINIEIRKWFIFLILVSFLVIWMDFYSACMYSTCMLWDTYDMSFLGYHLALYPFILIAFWIFPMVFLRRYYKIWLFGLIFVWTMNDFLWFLVSPSYWSKFWQFKGDLIAKFYLVGDIYIPVYDFLMAFSIFIRLAVLVVLWNKIKQEVS